MNAAEPQANLLVKLRLQRGAFALEFDETFPTGITAVFGPSGCGKTSLLRAVAGLERPTHGRIDVAGDCWFDADRGIWIPAHRRAMGFVFQEASLFEHLSVQGNLDYALRRSPTANRQALAELVDLLGIGPLLPRRTAQLSGGERQRVALARAMATAPRLLLLDEPMASLDAPRRRELMDWIERLHHRTGLPMLLVTHAVDEVLRLADHVVLMSDGRVQHRGTPTEMMNRVGADAANTEERAVVLDGHVAGHDARWGLDEIHLTGCAADVVLWLGASAPGGSNPRSPVRLRILARDVSLALAPTADTSLLNSLPAEVEQIAEESHPALALCRLRLDGGSSLLARLTRRSAAALNLQPGLAVWAQIKAVALIG